MPAVDIILVGLRLWAKKRDPKSFGLDDLLIVLSLVQIYSFRYQRFLNCLTEYETDLLLRSRRDGHSR